MDSRRGGADATNPGEPPIRMFTITPTEALVLADQFDEAERRPLAKQPPWTMPDAEAGAISPPGDGVVLRGLDDMRAESIPAWLRPDSRYASHDLWFPNGGAQVPPRDHLECYDPAEAKMQLARHLDKLPAELSSHQQQEAVAEWARATAQRRRLAGAELPLKPSAADIKNRWEEVARLADEWLEPRSWTAGSARVKADRLPSLIYLLEAWEGQTLDSRAARKMEGVLGAVVELNQTTSPAVAGTFQQRIKQQEKEFDAVRDARRLHVLGKRLDNSPFAAMEYTELTARIDECKGQDESYAGFYDQATAALWENPKLSAREADILDELAVVWLALADSSTG